MITKIAIENFKSLEKAEIDCSNLNVLTGLNGMGKSSVIQALLLLRQSHERGFLQKEGLALNGDLVNIGTVKDALYEFAETEEIKISLDFAIESVSETKSWFFTYVVNDSEKEEEDNYSGSDFMPYSEGVTPPNSDYIKNRALFKRNTFNYLNADRWVRNEYEMSDFNVVRNRSLGKHGQYTAHYLNYNNAKSINKDLLFPGSEVNELGIQVTEWMSEISPGTKVNTETIAGSESIKLRYVFEGNKASSNEIKPLNVGFGITYVLPVLVALLSAQKGDILIIENPESHIHPKGQSILGKLMAKVAETGVQIFVETHSDHIINGILVSLYHKYKKIENGISVDNVKINFFKRKDNSFSSELISIKIEENGRIKGVPDDFFDQYSKDMKTIIGF